VPDDDATTHTNGHDEAHPQANIFFKSTSGRAGGASAAGFEKISQLLLKDGGRLLFLLGRQVDSGTRSL